MIYRHILVLLCSLFYSLLLSSQTTKVHGRVFDGETGELMPFVSVSFTKEQVVNFNLLTKQLSQFRILSIS